MCKIKYIFLGLIILISCSGQGTLECRNGLVRCGDKCVNIYADPENCGSCGNRCEEGRVCENGVCTLHCRSGFMECDGECVNIRSDPENCGRCGNKCGAGEICVNGVCESNCPSGTVLCNGRCVDLTKDENNCGSCGHVCEENEECINGECVVSCPEGLTYCDGNCVDLNSDKENCGSCGNRCDDDEFCINGVCTLNCPSPNIICNGECVDPMTDRENRGGCGNRCEEGKICENGECVLVCEGNLVPCGDECVDINNDVNHCGGCNNRCRADQTCENGVCTCTGGKVDCNGECVDINYDVRNCGGCGNECAPGEVCIDGECTVTCPPYLELCDGICVDTNNDPQHCGSCNNACDEGQYCSEGQCVYGTCNGDICSDAIDVSQGGRYTGSNECAANDAVSNNYGGRGKDLFFKFTINEVSDVFISTIGSSFDTVLYVGNTCGGDNLGGNDDSNGTFQSIVTLRNLYPGTYYITLDGYSSYSVGDYVLDVYITPSSIDGDKCGRPQFIDINNTDQVSGNTCPWFAPDARDDTFPGCSFGTGGKDIVYYFVLTSTTDITFSTCNDQVSWDTVLYIREICNDVTTEVECNDDAGGECELKSTLNVTLDRGLYFLWLDGYNDQNCGGYRIDITRQ